MADADRSRAGRSNRRDQVRDRDADLNPGEGPRIQDLNAEQIMAFLNARFPVPGAPPRQAQFALSPALIDTAQPIDYGSSSGAKIYKNSTSPLPVKFDMEPESIFTFNDVLKDRCVSAAWSTPLADILTIPAGGINLNLIDNYGEITLQQVRDHCATFVNQESRRSQHSYQMYECLVNSLTDVARVKIAPDSDQYTVNGVRCGPLLYKYMMAKATIDTRATLSFIRENISNLNTYITTVSSNITTFNEYVKRQQLSLAARGGVTHDLMTNLWKAYLNVSDRDFVEFIKRKKDAYDEGENITADSLMLMAENKYRTLIQEERWNALSPEQTQIVALTAQLSKLKDGRLKLGKNSHNKKKGSDKDNKSEDKNDQKEEGKKRGKRSRRKNGKNDEKWAWKRVPPKDGEKHEKVYNSTTYYWCHDHGLWTLTKHTDENCYLKKKMNKKRNVSEQAVSPDGESRKAPPPPATQSVSFATQLQQMMDE